MAIQVGSVEVDVVPNTRGFYARMRGGLVPAGERVGQELARTIGQQITVQVSAAVRDGVQRGGRQATTVATRQGSESGGAFGRTFRTRVEAAMRNLPRADVRLGDAGLNADLDRLRARLQTLSGRRIGVDVDAATALAEIGRIEGDLQRLGANHPDVNVRVDTGQALAELTALRAEIDRLDGRGVDVRVDPVIRSFGMLVTAAAAFGPAILPVLPVVAAGLGAIAAAGVAAGVGLGALGAAAAPGIADVAGALQAQKAAQDAAARSTANGAAAAVAAQQRAIQLASATQSLAAAERNGARQVATAQEAVSRARQNAAQVAAQAAARSQQAARQVQDAERALKDAQRDAQRAQEDLTAARKSAADQLRDMNERLAGAALDERAAVLRVREAQEELNRTRADKKATQLQRDQAQLTFDQAVAALEGQRRENERLKRETAEANRAGVEGSETVRAAHERVADAQRRVADQARGVKDAQEEQARAAVRNAQDVADAQERIVDAQANVATAQQQAADSIASAQRQIRSAQLSAAGGADAAAAAQAKYQAALAKMTPAARGTFNSFQLLRGAFSAWSRSLQPAVMPIFTRALDGIRRSLPGLTPFVLAAAAAIGRLQDRISAGFKSPWWKEFKKDMAAATGPALEGLGVSFGRIFKGMAGVIQAFLPHMESISTRMQEITGRFAEWGSNLKGSPAFERFLAYSAQQGPIVANLLGNLLAAVMHLGVALAPMAATAISFINALANGLSAIPVDVLTVIGVTFASIAIGAKLAALALAIWRGAVVAAGLVTAVLTGQTLALNAAMRANVIGLIITLIAALVVGIIYAYQHSETFRNIVQGAWAAIQTAASFVWNNILKPIFSGFVTALQTVGQWATWLWVNILQPVFNFISLAARILLTALVVAVLLPIGLAIKGLGVIAMWLWENAIGPAFRFIGRIAMWLWRNILQPVFGWIGAGAKGLWNMFLKPTFNSIGAGIKLVGSGFKWVWDNILGPVFGWIGDKAKWLWDKAIRPAFSSIQKGVAAVGRSFEDAKNFIGRAWQKVEDLAKKPVKFIIEKVYNGGIVPTWNLVARAFGAPEIKKMDVSKWATGGVLPGYTPGKDVHRFYSPTGGGLELSGGEAIMRPEFTRAVGSGFVSTMNKIATSRGANGVKAALAPALGGNPDTPVQRFADGGIFGWIGKKVAGAGSAVWEGVKKGANWLGDTLEKSARAGVTEVVDPLLAKFPGADTSIGKMIRRIPTKIIDSIFGFSKEADKRGAGDILGGPRIQAALKWAKTQNGLAYQWGGNGNPSWDCSGFMSAIESVIRGQKPHRRWSTHAFNGGTAPGWVRNGASAFKVGITHAGVGHTAGTLGKTKVESRGGDGVVVGPRARGYNDKLFTSWYGFQPDKYDSGGYLQPGLNLAYNGTGRPEPVFTTQQANALVTKAAAPSGLQPGDALRLVVQGQEFAAYVDGRSDGRVVAALQPAITAMRANRKG
ncbi:hypothetical protein [Streptomyces sp. NPDC015131]|uniref:hypothetical protein n=1 Tax=Streptomyces sp. NPDC015131 TaxID=3364941 RepID=UPI0036F7F373